MLTCRAAGLNFGNRDDFFKAIIGNKAGLSRNEAVKIS
jgi:hypothetical protein